MADRTASEQSVLVMTGGQAAPSWLDAWFDSARLVRAVVPPGEDVVALALRGRPRALVIDARGDDVWQHDALRACRHLKADSFTSVIPVVMLVPAEHFADAFACGADEVLRATTEHGEAEARLTAVLRRSDRDVDVHPSTRLPGAREIEAELARRVAAGETFAACYADLDHFKEFNDRYGYHNGDRVIRLLAQILHDVVKGWCGAAGFVGHIGGDDFLYAVPVAAMARVCDDVVRVFDELIVLQYSEQDRRMGYFLGKDRRGLLHRVPLMTLSIGVVTNQRRRFTRATEVSELATEMKSYAKTLPGSLWTVDRRREEATPVAIPVNEFLADPSQRRAGGLGQ